MSQQQSSLDWADFINLHIEAQPTPQNVGLWVLSPDLYVAMLKLKEPGGDMVCFRKDVLYVMGRPIVRDPVAEGLTLEVYCQVCGDWLRVSSDLCCEHCGTFVGERK